MSRELTEEQQRFLLGLARRAIEHYFETAERLRPETDDPRLKENRGVFVTLKKNGELRGCIGYPLPSKPLDEAVAEMAVAAASEDFRFLPLTPDELAGITIEISVLSPPRPVGNAGEVEVGRHGIIIVKGSHRGLLLPQVPLEYGWDRETYLRHGCLKAGLDGNEWKKNIRIEVFEAQVFSEKE